MSMTDQNQSHPTQGRRRRRKSPANLSAAQHLPLPRLLDHMNAADGPSDDEEEEKDAKHQRSAPTTPRSISSLHPHKYDEVMGITRWNHGMRNGLRREMIQSFRMLNKLPLGKLKLVRRQNQRPVGLGKSTGNRQCHIARMH